MLNRNFRGILKSVSDIPCIWRIVLHKKQTYASVFLCHLDRKYTCQLIRFHWSTTILAFHIKRLSLFPLPHPRSLVKQISLLSKSCSLHWQQWWQVKPPWQACWGKEHEKYVSYRDVFASVALSLYTAKLKSVHSIKKDLVALVGDSFTDM